LAKGTVDADMDAIKLMNAKYDARALNTDPELKEEMERIFAADNKLTTPSRASDYASSVETYYLKDVAALSTKVPSDAAELWTTQDQMQQIVQKIADGDSLKADPKSAAAQRKLIRALSSRQASVYPALRVGLQKLMHKSMWADDIEVRIDGGTHRTITFIGATFAAHQNILTAENGMSANLAKLRFSRVKYQWYDGAGYTYYDLKSPPDNAVGNIENGAFKPVN
jgi:hypothetical protein